jgi:hypothetical protein
MWAFYMHEPGWYYEKCKESAKEGDCLVLWQTMGMAASNQTAY